MWSSNCLASSRLFPGPPKGGVLTFEEGKHGEGMGGGYRGRGGGDRLRLVVRAGDRVGDVQLHAVLPGDRDRGSRRGLAFGGVSVPTSLSSRLRVRRGGIRPPVLCLILFSAPLLCGPPSSP